jgi:hypothetical protein
MFKLFYYFIKSKEIFLTFDRVELFWTEGGEIGS